MPFSFSGESKGYGLIKYVSSDASAQARHLLDGRLVGSHKIVCDWLDSSHVTFASLHSKILYVDCLPANYRDNAEFRKMFSVEKNPCYCMVSTACTTSFLMMVTTHVHWNSQFFHSLKILSDWNRFTSF